MSMELLDTFASVAFGLLVIAWVGAVYFLPCILARKKASLQTVFAINLFLGWTLIGWVVALALAVWEAEPKTVPVPARVTPKPEPVTQREGQDASGRWVL